MAHINSVITSPLARISSSLNGRVTQSNLSKLQNKLLRLQIQTSTGKRLLAPSDDPVNAGRIHTLRVSASRIEQFEKNLSVIEGNLTLANASIDSISDIANSAKGLANSLLSNGSTLSGEEIAQQIQSHLDQIVTTANTRFATTFLFAGKFLERKPFELGTDYVLFTGAADTVSLPVNGGSRISVNVSPDDAFNVLSGVLKGLDSNNDEIDLDAALVSSTDVSLLNNGNGIFKGTLKLETTSAVEISLKEVENIGDIIAAINKGGSSLGISAAINSDKNGLAITAPGSALKITDLDNGVTAKKLGIFTETATSSAVTGSDINPDISIFTRLGDLRNGSGISLDGLVITNSTPSETFKGTIDGLTSNSTIGDLIAAINRSDAFVFSQLNPDGTGIDVYSRISNARLTITEATGSGTTAKDLGLLYSSATVGRVKLKDTNNGYGLSTIQGEDIKITKKNGETVLIDVDKATTVKDLVDIINKADPDLTASATTSGTIRISDTASGSGEFRIDNLEGSQAATELDIEGSVSGSGTVTITSNPIAFVGVEVENIFTSMFKIKRGAQEDDTGLVQVGSKQLTDSIDMISLAAAKLGFDLSTVEILKDKFASESLKIAERRSLIEDIDLAEVLSDFQLTQVTLQASLATTASLLNLTIFNFL